MVARGARHHQQAQGLGLHVRPRSGVGVVREPRAFGVGERLLREAHVAPCVPVRQVHRDLVRPADAFGREVRVAAVMLAADLAGAGEGSGHLEERVHLEPADLVEQDDASDVGPGDAFAVELGEEGSGLSEQALAR